MNRRDAIKGIFAGAAILASPSLIARIDAPRDDAELLHRMLRENKVIENQTFVFNQNVEIYLDGHTIRNCTFVLKDCYIHFDGNPQNKSSVCFCTFNSSRIEFKV